jgi:putative glutamine amidotransferase
MSPSANNKARVGVTFRSTAEEARGRQPERYLRMVEAAGAEPVLLSLQHPQAKLAEVARTLDAVVLPGSPADVDPSWYHADRRPKTADADLVREQADFTLLDAAFAERKPVLAICYGIQSLNVYFGGTLVQDIASEIDAPLAHNWAQSAGAPEPFHLVRVEAGSRLAAFAAGEEVQVNSDHHQAVARPGRNLRPVAYAPDGVIECLELVEEVAAAPGAEPAAVKPGAHWVTGVQWHPERMPADALAQALFRELVAAARKVPTP